MHRCAKSDLQQTRTCSLYLDLRQLCRSLVLEPYEAAQAARQSSMENFLEAEGFHKQQVPSARPLEERFNPMKTRNFTKTVLTVAGLLALGTFAPHAFAQSGQEKPSNPPTAAQPGAGTQGSGMRGHGDKMFADLNLTDDQKAQIKKIREDAKAKADAVKADTTLSDADKKAKFREIRKSARMESSKVLTAEQRAQLKEKMKERRAAKTPGSPS